MAYTKQPADKLRPSLLVPVRSVDRVTNPSHVLFDSRVLEPAHPDLVASIRERGFLGSIIVRRDGSRYQLIAGRRRHAACLVLDAEEREAKGSDALEDGFYIRVEVRDCSDEEAYDLMIQENELGQPYTDLQRATLIQRAVDRGRSMADACRPFGVTADRGYKLVQLLRLDDSVRAQVDSGAIPVSAGVALAELPRAEQVRVVEEHAAAGKKVTTDSAKQAVNPDGPIPMNTRVKLLQYIVRDKELFGRVKSNTSPLKTLLYVFECGDRAELENDPVAKEVWLEAEKRAAQK